MSKREWEVLTEYARCHIKMLKNHAAKITDPIVDKPMQTG